MPLSSHYKMMQEWSSGAPVFVRAMFAAIVACVLHRQAVARKLATCVVVVSSFFVLGPESVAADAQARPAAFAAGVIVGGTLTLRARNH